MTKPWISTSKDLVLDFDKLLGYRVVYGNFDSIPGALQDRSEVVGIELIGVGFTHHIYGGDALDFRKAFDEYVANLIQ